MNEVPRRTLDSRRSERQNVTCRPVDRGDAAAWVELRLAFWSDAAPGEHAAVVERYFAGTLPEPIMTLLAFDARHQPVGFVELSIRAYAEGCESENVAYVEGWFVVPEARGGGVGRVLIEHAEAWARREGCTELASDAQLEDLSSAAAHEAVGFAEAGRIRCFRKVL